MVYEEQVSAVLRRDLAVNEAFDPVGACTAEKLRAATIRQRVSVQTGAPLDAVFANISCYHNGLLVDGAQRRQLQTTDTFAVLVSIIISYERAAILNATQAVAALSNETVVTQILQGDQETLEQVLQSFTYEQVVEIRTVLAASKGDPHLQLAYGGGADFRGRNGAYYAFLSTPDMSVNVRITAADFVLRGVLVHGTFITEVHVMAAAGPAVSFWASEVGPKNFGWRMINSTCDGAKWNHQYIHTKRVCEVAERAVDAATAPMALTPASLTAGASSEDEGEDAAAAAPMRDGAEGEAQIEVEYSTLHFRTRDWHVRVTANPVYARVRGPTHRLDLSFRPSPRLASAMLWRADGGECIHGLVGQSFGSPLAPREGRRDVYPSSPASTQEVLALLRRVDAPAPPLVEFTTSAMAEGAIDGEARDYELASPRSTAFRFTCANA